MIKQTIDLLQSLDWHNTSENIHFAKGAYRYPRTIKETINTAIRWFKFKK